MTGGLHGENRLGGNSLLECTVFGSIVGEKLEWGERSPPERSAEGVMEEGAVDPVASEEGAESAEAGSVGRRRVTREELAAHAVS